MNRINQLTALFSCQFILGVCLVPPTYTQTVVETLPPPPQLNKSKQSPVPEEVFVPRDLDFRVPDLPVAQKVDSYLVYIDNTSPTQLEQIKQTIPTAFRRQHQGKTVIQAGIFSKELNAINLAQNLQSQGIYSHIVNLTTAKEVALKIRKFKS